MQNESRDIIFHPNLRYHAGPNEDFFLLAKAVASFKVMALFIKVFPFRKARSGY